MRAALSAAFAMTAATAFVQAPAIGQDAAASDERVSRVIVYGRERCPPATGDDIVICVRKPETERYRIPERFRTGGPRQTRQAWANKARALETVGATGINSCSPVGPAGFTGCLTQVIKQARAEANEAAAEGSPPDE